MSCRIGRFLGFLLLLAPAPVLADSAAEARALYDAKDCAGALAMALPLAAAGDAEAEGLMGSLAFNGCGMARDYDAALDWFGKAAAQGVARSQYSLGWFWVQGFDGYPRNVELARTWFEKAIAQDYPAAFTDLGFLYESGAFDGTPDYAAAVALYRRGRELGAVDSIRNLAGLTRQGLGVPEDAKAALALYRESAALGLGDAINDLGAMYDNGIGTVEDPSTAMLLYRRAFDMGQARAGLNLAYLYIASEDAWFYSPAYGLATCLWAVEKAAGAEVKELRDSCDEYEAGMEPEDVKQAKAIFAGF